MGMYAIHPSNDAANAVLGAAYKAAYDDGCYRGISPQEYAGLQDRVRGLSAEDRAAFDESPTFWTHNLDGAYSDVLNALRQDQTYEQYLQTERSRPPVEIDRPASCDLVS